MRLRTLLNPVRPIGQQLEAMEQTMSRRVNMIIFLVVRFVLMSGMVVGFSWWSSHFSP